MLQLRFNLYRNPIFWVIAALTAIALLLGLGLAYFSANLSSLFQREESYREYLNMTDNLKYNLLNAETGQRGYLISQDELYLRPYEAALPAIEKNLKDLNDSPTSRMYEDETQKIIDLVNRKMDELALTIKTLQTQGQDAAFAIVNTNEGISDMDTLRMLIRSVTDEQNTQLQSEVNSAQTQVKVLGLLAPMVAILDIILIVVIFILTGRAIRREQQLDNLKEQFIALASHQLRTPATAVKQYLYLLISGTFGSLKKEQKDVLERINESNERGIKIANSLLNVTIADSGKATIGGQPINLGDLLQHVLTHYTKALKESRDQRIVLKLPKKAVMTKVDPFRIRLIFENLIENASKYSDDHTKIHVALRQTAEWITFSVQDEGVGIDKKDLPLLFKRFSRLDAAARKTEGSGLGLYLVKQAAEAHGGDVTVESTPGKGSMFTVKFKKVN